MNSSLKEPQVICEFCGGVIADFDQRCPALENAGGPLRRWLAKYGAEVVEGDADPYPAIVLEVLDGTAEEHEAQYSDGTVVNLAEHYGNMVKETDPIYRVQNLYIVDGKTRPGESRYTVPEGCLRLHSTSNE